jgi:membrane protein implicated in regulation of membrane protease activity
LAYSFLGGFVLILGARIADGCASGHILSGNMEMAVSSFVFAICVALSYFIFTKYFYKKG